MIPWARADEAISVKGKVGIYLASGSFFYTLLLCLTTLCPGVNKNTAARNLFPKRLYVVGVLAVSVKGPWSVRDPVALPGSIFTSVSMVKIHIIGKIDI